MMCTRSPEGAKSWRRVRVGTCLWLAAIFMLAEHPYATLCDVPNSRLNRWLVSCPPLVESGSALRGRVLSKTPDLALGLLKTRFFELAPRASALQPPVELVSPDVVRVNFMGRSCPGLEDLTTQLQAPASLEFAVLCRTSQKVLEVSPARGHLALCTTIGLLDDWEPLFQWCDLLVPSELVAHDRTDIEFQDTPGEQQEVVLKLAPKLASEVAARVMTGPDPLVLAIAGHPLAVVEASGEQGQAVKHRRLLGAWLAGHLDVRERLLAIRGLTKRDARSLRSVLRYAAERPRVEWSAPRILVAVPQSALVFLLLGAWLSVEMVLATTAASKIHVGVFRRLSAVCYKVQGCWTGRSGADERRG